MCVAIQKQPNVSKGQKQTRDTYSFADGFLALIVWLKCSSNNGVPAGKRVSGNSSSNLRKKYDSKGRKIRRTKTHTWTKQVDERTSERLLFLPHLLEVTPTLCLLARALLWHADDIMVACSVQFCVSFLLLSLSLQQGRETGAFVCVCVCVRVQQMNTLRCEGQRRSDDGQLLRDRWC